MERYLKNGREIFDTYCSFGGRNPCPVMFPRAPEQTYIDVYSTDEEPDNHFRDDILQQSNYEAEVKLYRALEGLKVNVIVLHNFEYTHHQYRLCDRGHVRKGCPKCKNKNAANREGECDFLIIGEGYFVIMEVKNMTHVGDVMECEPDFHLCTINEGTDLPGCDKERQLQALNGTFAKSLQQRTKIVDLIKSIEKGMTILQFTAYPNFSKNYCQEFRPHEDKISTIVFDEDIENFSHWWQHNVSSSVDNTPQDQESIEKYHNVRDMLLAVWCTDKNECDISKCSLGRCVRDVDLKLKSGKFTFRSSNPGVVSAPPIVKNYLGIENLTKQQFNILQSEQPFLWIIGPAGAGKTVILLAKIIQLVNSTADTKVVFFIATGWEDVQLKVKPRHYQLTLEKAGVKCLVIGTNNSFHTPSVVAQEIEQSKLDNQVVMVHMSSSLNELTWLTDVISMLSDCSIFIDDVQCFLGNYSTNENHFEFLKQLLTVSLQLAGHYTWVGCDIMQCFSYLFDIRIVHLLRFLSPHQHSNLSMNLRNTNNLSKALSVIRNQLLARLDSERSDFARYIVELQQFPGHYIHGPKIVVHVRYCNADVQSTVSLINEELDRLCHEDILKLRDIGILVGYLGDLDHEDTLYIKNILSGRFPDEIITLARPESSYSSEWPALIAVLKLNEGNPLEDLIRLYVSMSRARVFCSIILHPEEGRTIDNYSDIVNVLVELKAHSRVILHTEEL